MRRFSGPRPQQQLEDGVGHVGGVRIGVPVGHEDQARFDHLESGQQLADLAERAEPGPAETPLHFGLQCGGVRIVAEGHAARFNAI